MVWAYDFDIDEGTIENRRVFIEVPREEGVPDGATVDADGFLWVAHMRGGRVKRYDPDGKVERRYYFLPLSPRARHSVVRISRRYTSPPRRRFLSIRISRVSRMPVRFSRLKLILKGLPNQYSAPEWRFRG